MSRKLPPALLLATALACLSAGAGCSQYLSADMSDTASIRSDNLDPEQRVKKRVLDEVEGPPATPLSLVRRLQSHKLEGGAFVMPASLAAAPDGGVYISDNNAHLIHYNPPHSEDVLSLPRLSGVGKLNWPNTIQLSGDSLVVVDNDGLKFFGRDGSFRRLVKSYYGMHHFTTSPGGNILLNPTYAGEVAAAPLIVEVNGEGTRVKEFGRRLSRADHAGLDDRAYLCSTEGHVVAVFSHRPRVQVYDRDGRLLREFDISHPLFPSLDALAEDESFVRPGRNKYRLPVYVAGARLIDDRLLVLLHLPRPEVVEFGLDGREVARYRGDALTTPTTYMGFDARLDSGTYSFYLLAGDTDRLMALMEYAAPKAR